MNDLQKSCQINNYMFENNFGAAFPLPLYLFLFPYDPMILYFIIATIRIADNANAKTIHRAKLIIENLSFCSYSNNIIFWNRNFNSYLIRNVHMEVPCLKRCIQQKIVFLQPSLISATVLLHLI